jgi:hypothetical protein
VAWPLASPIGIEMRSPRQTNQRHHSAAVNSRHHTGSAMSHPPPLFLRLNNEARGPFAWDRLCELAESGVITPATKASSNRVGPWTPISEAGDYAAVFPLRTQLQFKARPFEAVNRPSDPPVDHHALIAAANWGRPAPPTAAPPAAAQSGNEVEDILRLNREREKQAGLDQLKPAPPGSNRRRRDYLMLLISGNLVLFFGLNAIGGLALGGVVAAVFTVGLTWAVYGIMDKY